MDWSRECRTDVLSQGLSASAEKAWLRAESNIFSLFGRHEVVSVQRHNASRAAQGQGSVQVAPPPVDGLCQNVSLSLCARMLWWSLLPTAKWPHQARFGFGPSVHWGSVSGVSRLSDSPMVETAQQAAQATVHGSQFFFSAGLPAACPAQRAHASRHLGSLARSLARSLSLSVK